MPFQGYEVFEDMTQILRPIEGLNHVLDMFTITERNLRASKEGIPPGDYMRLYNKYFGEVIMSNTPYEMKTNLDFVKNAHGDVLICGLGIGMILLPIQNNPLVRSVIVLEKHKDIIEMIRPQLPLNNKVVIVKDDCFTHEFHNKKIFDCIYIDIWGDYSSSTYIEMVAAKEHLKPYLKPKKDSPNRIMKCWIETECRALFREFLKEEGIKVTNTELKARAEKFVQKHNAKRNGAK